MLIYLNIFTVVLFKIEPIEVYNSLKYIFTLVYAYEAKSSLVLNSLTFI